MCKHVQCLDCGLWIVDFVLVGDWFSALFKAHRLSTRRAAIKGRITKLRSRNLEIYYGYLFSTCIQHG